MRKINIKINKKLMIAVVVSILLIGLVIAFFQPIQIKACFGNPYDFIVQKGKVTINGYTGREEHVVVPERILGMKVVVVDWDTFEGMEAYAKKVDVPDTIQEVNGIYHPESATYYRLEGETAIAVSYVGKEKSVKIPSIVWNRTVVGLNGSHAESDIEEVFIPDTVKEINYAFTNCKALKKVTAGGVISLTGAFSGAVNLEEVSLGDDLKEIRSKTFSDCKRLFDFEFPEGLEYIGTWAFQNSGIKEIHIPNSLKEIAGFAFEGSEVEEVTNIEVVDVIGWEIFRKTPWLDKQEGDFVIINNTLQLYKGEDIVVKVPEGVTKIAGGFAIYKDEEYPINVSEIYLPDSVTCISAYSFEGQDNVVVYIPDSVKEFAPEESGEDKRIFDSFKKNETIVTTAGSYAEAYAKEMGYRYRIVDSW